MKYKKIFAQLFALFIGFLAGLAGFVAMLFLESPLTLLTKFFLSGQKSSYNYWFLLIPASIEEIVKISFSNALRKRFDSIFTVIGVGLGVGFAEALATQDQINWHILNNKLLYLHLVFLLGGLFLARLAVPKSRCQIFWWLGFSILLHWGYNTIILSFKF